MKQAKSLLELAGMLLTMLGKYPWACGAFTAAVMLGLIAGVMRQPKATGEGER